MAKTPNLEFTRMTEGQSGGEILFNENFNLTDVLLHLALESIDLSAPPGTEVNGQIWYVSGTGSGDWLNHDGELAYYFDGWFFSPVAVGMFGYVKDILKFRYWDGAAWSPPDITP